MRTKKNPCPCCGRKVITTPGDYEICKYCGWEDDPAQSQDPDFAGGANELSLNEAKEKLKAEKNAAK